MPPASMQAMIDRPPASNCSDAYDVFGRTYCALRQPDPRIADTIFRALGDAPTVLNVGAGTGSYEPTDRWVLAVEPSEVMISQRPREAPPAIRATAEALPFPDDFVDASMALMTLHHWGDWRAGVRELKRVTRRRIVIWTFDPAAIANFWLVRDYLPELLELELARCPPMGAQVGALDGHVQPVHIPRDCRDGVLGAYWARPEAYLDSFVRSGISLFYLLGRSVVTRALRKLARDLESGVWHKRNAEVQDRSELDVGYRLLVVDVSKVDNAISPRRVPPYTVGPTFDEPPTSRRGCRGDQLIDRADVQPVCAAPATAT
jgi:SAM-dependent methyltransferase